MIFTPSPRLVPGDKVAVVAPSGPFDRAGFEKGLAILAARYQPVFDEGLFSSQRYLAGDDSRRARELQHAFEASDLKAVFAARGGYGAMRLLPKFRVAAPRAFVGFSDLTAVHSVLQRHGHISIHGPVLTQLGTQPAECAQRLFSMLESPQPAAVLSGVPIVSGVAEGPLLGGNLSVFTRLIGTPYFPDTRGAVLLFEDIGERPYRLDRMWTHLELSGALDGIAGIALGDFTGCEEKGADYGSADVLGELARARGVPCVGRLTVGHGALNLPVALGARVRIDGSTGTLTALEGAVR